MATNSNDLIPSTLPPPTQGGTYMSPAQIAILRQSAAALQQMPKEGIKHWTQGLAYLLNVINGNRQAAAARELEQQGYQSAAQQMGQVMAPYLSPGGGGVPPSAAGAPGGGSSPPPGAYSGPQASATSPYSGAISGIESGGKYDTLGPVTKTGDRAYGKYQVMGANIPEWTKAATGKAMTPDEFLNSPDAQEAVFNHQFGGYVSKYGPEGAAKAWFAGEKGMNNPNAKDSLGTTVQGYANKFNTAMGAQPNPPVPPTGGGPTVPPKPIPPGGTPPEPFPIPNEPVGPTPSPTPPMPTRLAYAGPGNPPLPSAITQGQTPKALQPMISAIAGRPMPAPGGMPSPMMGPQPTPQAGPQMAQNGPPGGLPQPITSPTGQITQQDLTRILANPWIPDASKTALIGMIQQRGQPQTMDVEGGKLMYNAAGQRVFIPEPKFGSVKIGSAEVPTVSHYDPATKQWTTTTLAPGGGVQGGKAAAGEPDLSSIGGIQRAEAEQKGAIKGAEETASQSAKTYNTIHTGITGDAVNASRQAPVIDALQKIAPAAMTGSGADAKLGLERLAATLGVDPKGAAPRELFNMLAAKVLADQFAGIKNMSAEEGSPGGRIFKSMLDVEEKANITHDDTLEGVQAKLGLLKQMGEQVNRWADMADDYVAKNGRLDAGFMKDLRKDMASTKYTELPGSNSGKTEGNASFVGRTATNPKTGEKMREVAPNEWEPVK